MILFLSFRGVLAGQEAPSAGRMIPAISGTVVDAVAGKPVSGVDVILRAQRDSPRKQLRYESCSTSADGRFHFSASVDSEAVGLFSPMLEISLSINKVFVSVDQLRAATHEDWQDSDGLSDVSWFAVSATLPEGEPRRVLGVPPPRLSDKAYFPMSAQFLRDCGTNWNVTCIVPDSFNDVRIPLMPVLSDPSECKKISDADLSDRCRQLNTYHAAFMHADSFAQVRAAKESCRNVDHGRMSQECLQRLQEYLRPSGRNEVPAGLLREYEPKEKMLILEPVAGLVPRRPSFDPSDPFNEEGTYGVSYAPDRGRSLPGSGARVSVFVGGTAESRKQFVDRALWVNKDDTGAVLRKQMLFGNPITVLEFDRNGTAGWATNGRSITTQELNKEYVTVWTSEGKIIAINITYPSAGDVAMAGGEENARNGTITPEMRRELIRAYLQKYPSSD